MLYIGTLFYASALEVICSHNKRQYNQNSSPVILQFFGREGKEKRKILYMNHQEVVDLEVGIVALKKKDRKRDNIYCLAQMFFLFQSNACCNSHFLLFFSFFHLFYFFFFHLYIFYLRLHLIFVNV